MKNKIVILVLLVSIFLTSCSAGNKNPDPTRSDYQVFINHGSAYAVSFQDYETGVWYILGGKGICPRYNPDGSLYVTDIPTQK